MRNIWQSLIWKEWHEHKWKLVMLTCVLCGVNALLLLSRSRETLGVCFWMTTVVVMPLAMFVGAATAAGESSRRTAAFLGSLPVVGWRVAVVKLVAGLITLCVSIAATSVFVCAVVNVIDWPASGPSLEQAMQGAWQVFPSQFRGGNWFVATSLSTMAVAASIYVWTAAAGLYRADEVAAAAKAALVMFGWWGVLLLGGMQLPAEWFEGAGRKLVAAIMMASPGGALVHFDAHSAAAWAGSSFPLWFGFVAHLGIAGWFVYSYGRLAKTRPSWRIGGIDAEDLVGWLRPPGKSQLATIAWKQARESAPVVIVGLGAALLIAILIVAVDLEEFSIPVGALAEFSAVMVGAFSIFITLVVGVGVSHTDSSARIESFWQSRPINPDAWFWTKIWTGFAVLVVCLLVPAYSFAALAHLAGKSKLWEEFWGLAVFSYIGINVALYFTAVATTRLVRHPIYGAILAIAVLLIGPLLFTATMLTLDYVFGYVPELKDSQAGPIASGTVAVAATVVTLLSWLATRNNWGWQKG
jgi:hypothetical protein